MISLRQCSFEVLESIPVGREFSSQWLRDSVCRLFAQRTGERKDPFHDTILRYMRDWRHNSNIVCVSREKSYYRRIA